MSIHLQCPVRTIHKLARSWARNWCRNNRIWWPVEAYHLRSIQYVEWGTDSLELMKRLARIIVIRAILMDPSPTSTSQLRLQTANIRRTKVPVDSWGHFAWLQGGLWGELTIYADISEGDHEVSHVNEILASTCYHQYVILLRRVIDHKRLGKLLVQV